MLTQYSTKLEVNECKQSGNVFKSLTQLRWVVSTLGGSANMINGHQLLTNELFIISNYTVITKTLEVKWGTWSYWWGWNVMLKQWVQHPTMSLSSVPPLCPSHRQSSCLSHWTTRESVHFSSLSLSQIMPCMSKESHLCFMADECWFDGFQFPSQSTIIPLNSLPANCSHLTPSSSVM